MDGRAEIEVLIEHDGWAALELDALASQAAIAVLARLGIEGPAEVALLATSDAAIARLNADFRDKPTPTNVLSWPARDLSPASPGAHPGPPIADETGDLVLGDIALAYETCLREAQLGGKPLRDHAMHLVVHAILHLLGYDHTCEGDARLMEGLETEILATLGVSDPYFQEARET